jgi:hypothetical protein
MESRMSRMMEERMARMPATAPPRVMFDNLAAIREQTTRILELLEPDTGGPGAGEEPSQAREG